MLESVTVPAAAATLFDAPAPPWFSRSAKYTSAFGSSIPSLIPWSTYAATSASARSSCAAFPDAVVKRALITVFSAAVTVLVPQSATVVISR